VPATVIDPQLQVAAAGVAIVAHSRDHLPRGHPVPHMHSPPVGDTETGPDLIGQGLGVGGWTGPRSYRCAPAWAEAAW